MDSLFTSYGSSPVLVSDPLSVGSVEAGSDSMDRLEYLSGREGREEVVGSGESSEAQERAESVGTGITQE